MRIILEIDDDEVRRVLGPLIQPAATFPARTPTRLMTVQEVADHLGVSRSKAYQLVLAGEIKSMAIGRSRRVSPGAIAEFIARPGEHVTGGSLSQYKPAQSAPLRRSTPAPSNNLQHARRRRRNVVEEIDLAPKADSRELKMTDEEWDHVQDNMLEHGWLPDVVDQVNADRQNGVRRTYALPVKDAVRYLGLTRYGVEKLIKDGRLRLFTITPIYANEKPQQYIPASDVLALK